MAKVISQKKSILHRWGWDKDKDDIIQLIEYAKMNDNWNWDLLIDRLPKSSIIKTLLKKIHNKISFYKNLLRD